MFGIFQIITVVILMCEFSYPFYFECNKDSYALYFSAFIYGLSFSLTMTVQMFHTDTFSIQQIDYIKMYYIFSCIAMFYIIHSCMPSKIEY